MIQKRFITPDQLRVASFGLAARVVQSTFRPKFLVALWRGGATIGCYVHEYLGFKGIESDHIAIRTSRYTGVDCATEEVIVHNLTYLKEQAKAGDSILLVDDVWDSGKSIEAFTKKIEQELGHLNLVIRIATVFYKPKRNHLSTSPDYFVEETDDWLVFPHELESLSRGEIELHFGAECSKIIFEPWKSIREKDIRVVYEWQKARGLSASYRTFEEHVREAELETWQTIRENDIRVLYERTKARDGYSGPYEPFRRYVTQADLGAPYVEAPSDLDYVKDRSDDLRGEIWLAFE
jgi:hypothetical protein